MNLFNKRLTTFLTSTLLTRKKSLLERCKEIIIFFLDQPEQRSYMKKCTDYYDKDRRYYWYAFNKLRERNILQFHSRRSSCVFLNLNPSVKKRLGSVSSPHETLPETPQLQTPYVKNYRDHRRCFTFEHNLNLHNFHKLKGKWLKNDTLIITEEFDGHFIEMQISRKKWCIYPPQDWDNDYILQNDMMRIFLGEFVAYLKRKYLYWGLQLDLMEPVKHEKELYDGFHSWLGDGFTQAGIKSFKHPDWSFDASLGKPAIEHNQQWFQVNRKGIGQQLYTDLLYMPQHYKQQTQKQLETFGSLKTAFENLSTYIIENLATRTDVETIRADITDLIPRKDEMSDKLIQCIMERPKSLLELTYDLNITKSAVINQVKKVTHMIIQTSRKGEGRGRPQRIYTLKEKYKNV